MRDPPLQLVEPPLEGEVVGDGHELGQDGAGGLELDRLGGGLPGELGDLVGGGGGVVAEASGGAVEDLARMSLTWSRTSGDLDQV